LDRERFDLVRQRHGGYASWAVWAAPTTAGPKSNIADLSILDPVAHPETLPLLKPDVIMVGLNISNSGVSESFRNFHSSSPSANDFKIRHAFTGTPYYGAYMTDVIKNVTMVSSADLLDYLRDRPTLVGSNIEAFRQEIRDLTSGRPTILAFGTAAHRLLAENLESIEYRILVRLTHYSHRIEREKYRRAVLEQIGTMEDPR
jgi:hypothetical protein